ncbi:Mur ligase domain-containing protein, partial [Bacillus sp. B-TM1]
MHLHILGICGTFMGSLALLARDLGHKVTGSDSNVYRQLKSPGLNPPDQVPKQAWLS